MQLVAEYYKLKKNMKRENLILPHLLIYENLILLIFSDVFNDVLIIMYAYNYFFTLK